MRLATFNLENLFERPVAFQAPGDEGAEEALNDCVRLNDLFKKDVYDDATRSDILDLVDKLHLQPPKEEGTYVRLRETRRKLLKDPKDGPLEVVAEGRTSWTGWAELVTATPTATSVQNTAQVIADKGADIQAVVEVENRSALRTLAKDMAKPADGERYQHAMEIEGNDHRGINVGLLARHRWDIVDIRTHVDDEDEKGRIFSRDCAEYTLQNGSGAPLVVLVNHFKSQIWSDSESGDKRKRQAHRVAEIYSRLLDEGHRYIAVVGDLNDTPQSPSLEPLLNKEVGLRDVSEYRPFDDGMTHGVNDGGLVLGTYGKTKASLAKGKLDYILLSPDLYRKLKGAGIYRKGVWHSSRSNLWAMYPNMGTEEQPLTYADIDL